MTLVLIGPACEDLIIIGNEKSSRIGGASYFQSFVYEEFYNDYIAIVNTQNTDLINEFPDMSKTELILKDDTHYFVNEYPNKDNMDIRKQSTNFADIPILKNDLEAAFDKLDLNEDNIDAFVLNPLNSNDIPMETIEYLNSFNLPIFISLQGFLRFKDKNNSMALKSSEDLDHILNIAEAVFLDEKELEIICDEDDADSGIEIQNPDFEDKTNAIFIITNGSKGSRITDFKDINIKIDSVKCDNIEDATGCGDSYMAAFISCLLNGNDLKQSGDFASLIASEKLGLNGPYRK